MAAPAFAATTYAATQNLLQTATQNAAPQASGQDFASLLRDQVETARQTDQQIQAAAQGKGDLLSVVTAISETESSLQTLVAVRDKVIAAYEDVMRMAI
jgi:flagellar hook-basal body complex protein FliE